MKRINRYIMRQLASVTVSATIILCIAVMLIQSVRLVDMIINRGLPVTEFAYMASLMIPKFVALVMPIALFGAVLFSYNRMIQDSELIVMRSAGMSAATLAKPGLVVAVMCSLFCLLMTLYFMPVAATEMRFHVDKNRSQWGAALLHEGRFTTVGDHITIFVKQREGSELFGLLYHNQEDASAPYTIMAERGAVVDSPDGPRILVVNGNRQSFKDGTMHMVEFDRTTIDIRTPANRPGSTWAQPEERLLPDLLSPDMSDANDAYYHDKLIAEAHNRLATPLLPIAYSVIALAFILRGGFSRKGNTTVLLGAVICMILVLIGHMSLISSSGADLRFVPGIYLNAIVPILIGLVFIFRSPRHKRRLHADAVQS